MCNDTLSIMLPYALLPARNIGGGKLLKPAVLIRWCNTKSILIIDAGVNHAEKPGVDNSAPSVADYNSKTVTSGCRYS